MSLLRMGAGRPFDGSAGGGGGGGFTGAGDVVSGAAGWWGLQAYNGAYATGSNPAIDIVKASDGSALQTINILSTGYLDVATINALGYAVKVKKLYDQTGNGVHMSQATLANMPTLTLSALGSLPGITFDNSSQQFLAASGNTGTSLPLWISSVSKQTGGFGALASVLKHSTAGQNIGYDASSNFYEFSGNLVTATAAGGTVYAAQCFISGAGSGDSIYLNGSLTGSLNAGTTNMSGNVELGGDLGGQNLAGIIFEIGIWSGDKTASNSAMNTNQHSASRWNF